MSENLRSGLEALVLFGGALVGLVWYVIHLHHKRSEDAPE